MSDSDTHFKNTKYGFKYGAAKVERFFSEKGRVFISVTTPKEQLYIRVTKTGLIRVGIQKFDGTQISVETPISRKNMERIPRV